MVYINFFKAGFIVILMKILLDTNFILSCVKQKIDFLSEPYEFILAEEVMNELDVLSKKEKGKEKEAAILAIQILEKANLQRIRVDAKDVDKGLIRYAKNNDVIIATLDRRVKDKSGKPVMVIKDKKGIEII